MTSWEKIAAAVSVLCLTGVLVLTGHHLNPNTTAFSKLTCNANWGEQWCAAFEARAASLLGRDEEDLRANMPCEQRQDLSSVVLRWQPLVHCPETAGALRNFCDQGLHVLCPDLNELGVAACRVSELCCGADPQQESPRPDKPCECPPDALEEALRKAKEELQKCLRNHPPALGPRMCAAERGRVERLEEDLRRCRTQCEAHGQARGDRLRACRELVDARRPGEGEAHAVVKCSGNSTHVIAPKLAPVVLTAEEIEIDCARIEAALNDDVLPVVKDERVDKVPRAASDALWTVGLEVLGSKFTRGLLPHSPWLMFAAMVLLLLLVPSRSTGDPGKVPPWAEGLFLATVPMASALVLWLVRRDCTMSSLDQTTAWTATLLVVAAWVGCCWRLAKR
jgi:hypothetical protein